MRFLCSKIFKLRYLRLRRLWQFLWSWKQIQWQKISSFTCPSYLGGSLTPPYYSDTTFPSLTVLSLCQARLFLRFLSSQMFSAHWKYSSVVFQQPLFQDFRDAYFFQSSQHWAGLQISCKFCWSDPLTLLFSLYLRPVLISVSLRISVISKDQIFFDQEQLGPFSNESAYFPTLFPGHRLQWTGKYFFIKIFAYFLLFSSLLLFYQGVILRKSNILFSNPNLVGFVTLSFEMLESRLVFYWYTLSYFFLVWDMFRLALAY